MNNSQVKFLRKIWRRFSGIEQRQLFSQLTNTQNVRQNRLHPFVVEALSLVAPELPTKTVAFENYDYAKSKFSNFGSDKDIRHSYGGIYLKLLEKK